MLKVIYSAVILHLLWSSPLSAQAQEYQPFPEYTEFAQANPSTMALFEACKSTEPSLQTVNELIEQGADVNAQLPAPFAGMTPLAYAVQTDQDGAIITALLEAGADPDWHWHLDNTDGSILVYAAVGNSNPKVIRQLIENGARVNPKPYKCPPTGGMRNPFTPLMASMSNRNPEIAATLLESGANIDTTDESLFSSTFGGFGGPKYEGPTALAYACGYNAHEVHPEVIPVLLEHGASLKPTVCDGQGNKRTPLMFLVQSPNAAVRRGAGGIGLNGDRIYSPGEKNQLISLEMGSEIQVSPLLEAAQALIDAGNDVNAIDENGVTPLMMAHPLFVPLLIEAGASVSRKSRSGDTALTLLLSGTDNPQFHPRFDELLFDAVKLLVESGANVNATGAMGVTPLIRLSSYSPEIARILILAGADVNRQDEHGRTALMMAVSNDVLHMTPELRALYMSRVLEPSEEGKDVARQVFAERDRRKIETITLLLDHGADLDAQDVHGMTALMRASPVLALALIERGADYSLRNNQGHTFMHRITMRPGGEEEFLSKIDDPDIQAELRELGRQDNFYKKPRE